jgi:predicted lipid-binding transport protein (Tim44 family)
MNSLPIDILIFAIVAGLIAYRYNSVLGAKDEEDDNRKNAHSDHAAKVIAFPGTKIDNDQQDSASALSATLRLIELKDPDFGATSFVDNAKIAFKMIVSAFINGDMSQVGELLNGSVTRKFQSAIKDREAGTSLRLDHIDHGQIVEASLIGSLAQITVRFTSTQTLLQNGQSQGTEQVSDLWTFSKNVYAQTPIWTLIEIMPVIDEASERV